MIKTVIKEIFIMGLLLIAVCLLMGVLLYEYMPNQRSVPTKQAYYTPENVKAELGEKVTELEKTEISYEITDADLSVYRQISSYKPGKADPFSLEEEKATEEGGSTGSNSNSKTSKSTTQDTENEDEEYIKNTNVTKSTNTFWEDESMK